MVKIKDMTIEERRVYNREYFEKNKASILQKRKDKRKATPKKVKILKMDKRSVWLRENYKKRINTDIQYKLRRRLSSNVRRMTKRFNDSGVLYVCKNKNIDYRAIIEHLSPFPKDIENYHIDHIIPLKAFDLTLDRHIKAAWNPINLKWVLCGDNESKSDIINFDQFPDQKLILQELNLLEEIGETYI